MQFIPVIERATAQTLPAANAGWGHKVAGRPLYIQQGNLVTERSVSPDGYGRFLIDILEDWGGGDISEAVPRDCTPWPRVLAENGYSTAAFGKWHLTPDGQQGPAGPFGRWPNGWGFDYFYGFLGGDSGPWDPCLAENQKIIGTPDGFYDTEDPYYLPDAMADKTIEWLNGVLGQDARKPFFVYFSTGCSHAPHHVPSEWADKYKGKFDQGWDRLREEVFARQKELGVIPAEAELTPRDAAFPAWDEVPDKLKAYYARQMEVYAGFSENADYNVGRVIDAIDELGELDNTLIIWIWGDGGWPIEAARS
jgi:arylsulfatase A-like enzyme